MSSTTSSNYTVSQTSTGIPRPSETEEPPPYTSTKDFYGFSEAAPQAKPNSSTNNARPTKEPYYAAAMSFLTLK
ncbi:hypothetical protein GQ43DRAFT_472422 [Delitschia confertaspora ATCC 74209]|uniref:Uncharacterized protein n=1 Tax=Delitschia confertaspora ATCC 74209 TaxID=1513339 RepID=A0A9P4MRS4_9PLEO|nr:hypothetical protein GQ43DRAFT_472422 [Delitschia confertaspora ATCC 74209]